MVRLIKAVLMSPVTLVYATWTAITAFVGVFVLVWDALKAFDDERYM